MTDMTDADVVVSFPEVEADALVRAVQAALDSQEEVSAILRAGAQQSVAPSTAQPDAARRFQLLLELGYLVASADGFAEHERNSLACLLETITGSEIDAAILQQHFADLEDGVQALGRKERLARAAAEIVDPVDTLGLVAMIAMADGTLSQDEHAVLVELGAHLGLQSNAIDNLVRDAEGRVRKELR